VGEGRRELNSAIVMPTDPWSLPDPRINSASLLWILLCGTIADEKVEGGEKGTNYRGAGPPERARWIVSLHVDCTN
jgi:hypothetical protein